jgi:hypothetical protein
MLEKKQHTLNHIEELESKARELLIRISNQGGEDDREAISTMTDVL